MPPTNEQDNHPAWADRAEADVAAAELTLTLAAVWVSASLARARVRTWLRAHGWPESGVHDLVLAVSEAVSNSVEHGYQIPIDDVQLSSASVHLHARMVDDGDGFRRVRLEVRDSGVWRAPMDGPSGRGRGLIIMRACTDHLVVASTAEGTIVSMISRPTPVRPVASSS